ncbi:hypothetical protein [Heliorestis convoluta]|uniref:HK97 gp10 family phage protein n=1 Tax=Heliorestis convoluta TaxID=356322 RepID=A0A5Q2N005_9FIRM|nr:hypothetical protein [Heliorestis convoluta]QGG47651.1 hypothetical protein FTV88_1551 [Heliorestis convoluta]
MATMNFNVEINNRLLRRITKETLRAAEEAVHDCVDDLIRVSSETAPHDKGILEKSHAKEVKVRRGQVDGRVDYTIKERYSQGNFNYALFIHEGTYNLGKRSRQKPGGIGMSGKHYSVGNKFLTRPLEGESNEYSRHIGKQIKRELER